VLIFFSYITPCSPQVFSPVSTALNPLLPPSPGPGWPAMYLKVFLQEFAVLPFFLPETDDFMALDVYTPKGCFGLTSPRFRISHIYARPLPPAARSVSPETSLPAFEFPYLFAGDFNIHNAPSDPCWLLFSKEEKESAPYFNRATDLGDTLLNTPGVYTLFPVTGTHRPSAIDLVFADPHMFLAIHSGDSSSLPSTRSEHTLILISLRPPSHHSDKPTPHWQDVDWPPLTDKLKSW